MAPEQVTGEAVDKRADLFAVGAILYQALTGRAPFAGATLNETIQRLTGPEPASMVAVEAADRGGFVPVLRRALAKPPAQRFPNADAFAAALQEAGEHPASPMPAYDDLPATIVRGAPPPPAQGGGRWDPETLQRVERALARYAGPMARVMVTQAARAANNSDELHQELARQLQNGADRSAFLRALGGKRIEPTLGPTARTGPGPAASAAGVVVVSAEAMTAAQTALAFHVGPIARMLVRQAATQASSGANFIELLCAHVTRPDEVTALRRRLRAEVEPKLR
jgi:serine/threonine-protein kinase